MYSIYLITNFIVDVSRKNAISHRPNSVSVFVFRFLLQNMESETPLAAMDVRRATAVSATFCFAFDTLFACVFPLRVDDYRSKKFLVRSECAQLVVLICKQTIRYSHPFFSLLSIGIEEEFTGKFSTCFYGCFVFSSPKKICYCTRPYGIEQKSVSDFFVL